MSAPTTQFTACNLPIPPVILIDAMGVLRDFYSVANLVFVGRTLVDLGDRQHGSDMIEPAALGKAVIVGPYTGNFAEAMQKFRAREAIMEVADEAGLEQAIGVLLSTPKEALAMSRRAAEVVKHEQGATARHAAIVLQILAAHMGEEVTPRAMPPAPGTVQESAPPPPPPEVAEIPRGKPTVIITRIGPVPARNPFAREMPPSRNRPKSSRRSFNSARARKSCVFTVPIGTRMTSAISS